jgi:hypothetical protein
VSRIPTLLENASKGSDGTRLVNAINSLAVCTTDTHSLTGLTGQSLITPENVNQRPQLRVTPVGPLIIRLMRVRLACPHDPPLDLPRAKNVEER